MLDTIGPSKSLCIVDRILQILAADLLLLQTDFASHEKANFSIFKFVHPIKMVTRLSVTLW